MGMSMAASAALSATGLGGLLGLTKAKLNVYKPVVPPPNSKDTAVHKTGKAEKTYEFDYNPKELKFVSEAVYKEVTAGTGETNPQQQYVGAKGSEMSLDLFYSVFEIGGLLDPGITFHDLAKLKNELLALTRPHKSTLQKGKTPCPPLVDFSWGSLITDPALVTKVDVIYTHMLADGTPVRMKATVTLKGTMKEAKATNPTSGGRTNRKTHTLIAGESLATVAYAEYNDAALWRAIAEENQIDDPMRLTAGSVLLLPAFEE